MLLTYVHLRTYIIYTHTHVHVHTYRPQTHHTLQYAASANLCRFLLSLSFTPLIWVQTDGVLKHIRLYHVFSALIRPAPVIPSPSLSSTRFYEMVLSTCVIYPRPPFVPPTHSTLPSLLPSFSPPSPLPLPSHPVPPSFPYAPSLKGCPSLPTLSLCSTSRSSISCKTRVSQDGWKAEKEQHKPEASYPSDTITFLCRRKRGVTHESGQSGYIDDRP